MENESMKPVQSPTEPSKRPARSVVTKITLIVTAVLVALVAGYFIVSNILNSNNSSTEKVLTVADLENASTDISSRTSDGSVQNLTSELKAQIDKQVADKQNPIETVRTLVGVLCGTVNAARPTQCVDYVREFLDNKMDTLKLESEIYGKPDEAQLSQWRAQFYADLAYGYRLIMDNKFAQKDGQPFNTTAEQLKYVKQYLDIAEDPKNWGEPQVSEETGRTWYFYEYPETEAFVEWRKQLEAGGGQ